MTTTKPESPWYQAHGRSVSVRMSSEHEGVMCLYRCINERHAAKLAATLNHLHELGSFVAADVRSASKQPHNAMKDD